MSNYLVTDTELTSVADAIRAKGGTSAALEFPGDFVTAIGNISGGGGSTLGTKTITANDTYDASDDDLDGYSQVTVSVPASAVDTGTKSISTNGTHDVTGYASASVAVPPSAVDVGTKAISTNGTHSVVGYASASVSVPASAVDSGTKSITANGNNQDVVGYAAVNVNVPNSYAAGDEGKVVSSGALVSQTSDTVTQNDTYDTTFISSLTVNVSGGGLDFDGDQVIRIMFGKYGDASSEIYVDFTKFPNVQSLESAFDNAVPTSFSKITIKPPASSGYSTKKMFYNNSSAADTNLTEINIDGTLYLKDSIGFVQNRLGLTKITGLLDLTNNTNANSYKENNSTNYNNMFKNCQSLITVSFVPGTMSMPTTDWDWKACESLSDASLVSIANSLKDTYSGTITFHATPKARLSTIMGTVATSNGLSTFTIAAGGTVSLEDFLTTTKGATLG